MYKKKILLITERRADYSRFKPILKIIKKDNSLNYVLVATGLHLLKKHGNTLGEIIKDKFKVSYKLQNFRNNQSDDGNSMVIAMGEVLKKVAPIIKKEKPDIILSGFDIGANFALTVAGAHFNIPIAHIQGGEVTGSIDESLRHAMSKFSNYHLVANLDAKKRLIKMGEKKEDIFVVGCPSLDALFNEPIINKKTLEKKFNLDLNKKLIVAIQHPVTSENLSSKNQISQTIQALKALNIQTLFVLPNNDAGYLQIIKEIKSNNFNWTPTLSLSEYKSILINACALVGNSSSGIHEATSFNVPVINIGTRQNGRLKPLNVINANYDKKDILKKIKYCLNDKKYRSVLKKVKNPYGDGKSASKIIKVLKNINLSKTTQKMNTY